MREVFKVEKIKSRFDDFKSFAMKGNVLDLAVGVVIGGAFGKIVTSLVNDVIMPLIGLITGRMDLSTLKIIFRAASNDGVKDIAELSLKYGAFLQSILDFLIIALSIYLFIKLIGKLKRKQEAVVVEVAPPVPVRSEVLLEEIRDLLKEQKKDHK